tara:strand:+ start:639 stop:791 length:153 start_codon:yes stop_codon:yes gene_type:complete
MAKKDVIKAVIYIDDVVDKSKKEIYQLFKKAIDKEKVNHFEIQTNDEARW